MKHCVGLDVSVKETAICIVDETGKIVREAKVTTDPEAIVALLMETGFEYTRIGLEAGPMSQWIVAGLLEVGLPVVCVETRHMKAVLKAQQVNKSDRKRCARDSTDDARRIVQASARQDTGKSASTDAADVAQAVTRQTARP